MVTGNVLNGWLDEITLTGRIVELWKSHAASVNRFVLLWTTCLLWSQGAGERSASLVFLNSLIVLPALWLLRAVLTQFVLVS